MAVPWGLNSDTTETASAVALRGAAGAGARGSGLRPASNDDLSVAAVDRRNSPLGKLATMRARALLPYVDRAAAQ